MLKSLRINKYTLLLLKNSGSSSLVNNVRIWLLTIILKKVPSSLFSNNHQFVLFHAIRSALVKVINSYFLENTPSLIEPNQKNQIRDNLYRITFCPTLNNNSFK